MSCELIAPNPPVLEQDSGECKHLPSPFLSPLLLSPWPPWSSASSLDSSQSFHLLVFLCPLPPAPSDNTCGMQLWPTPAVENTVAQTAHIKFRGSVWYLEKYVVLLPCGKLDEEINTTPVWKMWDLSEQRWKFLDRFYSKINRLSAC